MRPRVYVAGPISKGDTEANVQRGIEVGLQLLEAGYAPFIPHLSARAYPSGDTSHLVGTALYEKWLEVDLAFIAVCDAVLRLPGESAGADREVEHAYAHNIPVFKSIEELDANFRLPNRLAA